MSQEGLPLAKRSKPPPKFGKTFSGPPAATGFGEGKVNLTMEQAKANLLAMSKELNDLINTQVSQISQISSAVKEDDFVGMIGGPLEAPVSDAERAVASKVLGEGNATPEVVGKARTIVASMIAGLIAYSNQMGVLVPAVDAAAGVGAVAISTVANFTSAISQVALGLLSMPSLPMTGLRAAVPIAGFLCNPNVLALLPILFLGYSLSGKDARQSLHNVLTSGKDAIVEKVESVYGLSKEAANNLVSRAVSVIEGAGDGTISMIQAASSVYLNLFASACAVVGSAQVTGQFISSVPGNIAQVFKSVNNSIYSGMDQARAGVDSFADRIKAATMEAAGNVIQQCPSGDGASMGGRKTRKRVGRRHRGKRGASTRKGKGKGRGKTKRGGSTRKGKGKSKGRGKAKGKGRGSSTRRRHSRKH